MNPVCTSGSPKHLWKTIKFSRYLPDNFTQIIDPLIKQNGNYGSPKNILICMLFDDREGIRKIIVSKIVKARQNSKEGTIDLFKYHR